MSSTSSSSGNYTLTVTFAVGTDLDTSLALVQNFVNGAMAQLPETVQAQGVQVKQVSTNILQVVSLYSDDNRFDETYLSNYGMINLQYPLARLPGVGQIKIIGAGSYSHADVAGPQQAPILRPDHHGRGERHPAAKRPGGGRAAGGPAGARRSGLSVHHQRLGKARRRQAVRRHHCQDGAATQESETAQIVRVKDLARVDLAQQILHQFCRSDRQARPPRS